jgi:hypothetical protein
MRNDVVADSVSTIPSACMGVVGIVQSLAVGVLLENASLFQFLKADQTSSRMLLADLERPGFWLALFQATTAFSSSCSHDTSTSRTSPRSSGCSGCWIPTSPSPLSLPSIS